MVYTAFTLSPSYIEEQRSAPAVAAEWRREKSCFWGRRNASSPEIPWSNYRAREGKLFVPPFITLINKSGGAVFSGGRGGGELRGLTKVGES